MPVVLRIKGYRFWFYAVDLYEPPHVHVGRQGCEAKYWIEPIGLARVRRFRSHELDEIERILDQHRGIILDFWYSEQEKHGRHQS